MVWGSICCAYNIIVLMMTTGKCVNDICQSDFDHGGSSGDSQWWYPIKEEISQASSVKDIKFNTRHCWTKQRNLKTWRYDLRARRLEGVDVWKLASFCA